jgi:hypothetical protein
MQQASAPIEIGWTVRDRDGEKVGSIAEVGPNYVLVHKGVIFGRDIYVPTAQLIAVDPAHEAVQIPVRRDDLDDQGWDEPPEWTPVPSASRGGDADDGLPTDLSVFRATATEAAQS